MIAAGPDRTARAVRRAAAATGLGAALLGLLALLDHTLPGGGVPAAGWPGTVLAAAVGLLPVVLGPAAIRILAHPGNRPLPPQAEATAVSGVAAALCCLGAGVAVVGLDLLASAPGAGRPVAARVVLLAVMGTITMTGAVAAAELHRLRAAVPLPGPAATGPGIRPDLVDDLATLTARALPGGILARGLARLNRGMDSWSWSPRRHPFPVIWVPRAPSLSPFSSPLASAVTPPVTPLASPLATPLATPLVIKDSVTSTRSVTIKQSAVTR